MKDEILKVFEYRKKITALKEEGNEILTGAEEEEERDLSEEEQEKLDAINAEIDKMEARMDTYIRTNRISDEDLRVVEPTRPMPGETSEEERMYPSFGQQLMDVAAATSPEGFIDRNLIQKRAISGMSATVPSDGGFLVQKDFSTDLMRLTHETGVLAKMCGEIEVSENSDGVVIPYVDETSRANGSRWGGVQVYRRAEGDTVTAKKPKFGEWKCDVEDMMGLCYVTNRLLKDAKALEGYVKEAFAEEFGFKLDDEIIRGTGAGQCLGILEAGCKVTQDKESGQDADTVVAENVTKMWSRMIGRFRANAAWFINQEVEPQLDLMNIAVGTGGIPVYMPPGGLADSPYGRLKGRPVISIEQCSALGDEGDIILGDLKQYKLVKKGTLEAAASIHVRFIYDEMCFRFIMRVNGQPKMKSALTPYKGANTLSTFVTLQART